ncbi:MAG TPA: hypothetical protein DF715_14485 [Oceanicaulis sp.]|nr:hypothetical protein [Oceanicaulis sp.]
MEFGDVVLHVPFKAAQIIASLRYLCLQGASAAFSLSQSAPSIAKLAGQRSRARTRCLLKHAHQPTWSAWRYSVVGQNR